MAIGSSATFNTSVGNVHDGAIRVICSEASSGFVGPFQVFVSAYYGETLDELNNNSLRDVLHQSSETADDSPEISFNAGGNGGYSVDIPVGTDGHYKDGFYQVSVKVWDEDTAAFVDDSVGQCEIEFNVKPDETYYDGVDFSAEYDCVTGIITATDNTDNTGWEAEVGRTITLLPPQTPDDLTPTPETDTTTDAAHPYSTTFNFAYTNATYGVALRLNRSKFITPLSSSGTFGLFQHVEGVGKILSLDIECGSSTGICAVAACVEAKYTVLEAKACGGGGWGNLTDAQKADMEYILVLNTIRQMYLSCGNLNKAGEYQQKLVDFTGCGCGCDDTGQPQPYTAPAAI